MAREARAARRSAYAHRGLIASGDPMSLKDKILERGVGLAQNPALSKLVQDEIELEKKNAELGV